ncbi:MAG: ABC transporter substrate-binding protein [Eubacteriales bacterium]
MKKINTLIMVCLLGVALICSAGCSKTDNSSSSVDTAPKIAKVRINADIKNMDPARRYTRWDDVVSATLFNGLVTYGPNGYDIQNDLAEKIEYSEDGKEIYFKLSEGVQFHNGNGEVTAEDVKFSYERFLDEETASSYKDDWAKLDHVEVISKYEGNIVLTDTFAPLMTTTLPLNSGSIVPKDYVEEVGLENFTTDVIGTGPYYLDSWEPNQKVVVKRNPDYFGEAPYWDEIDFMVISDHQSAELALQAGEIDFGEISPNAVTEFQENKNFVLLDNPDLDYKWIGMNVENPKLADVNVRNAIRCAINVPDILQVAYNGQVEQATGLIAPDLIGYWADAPVYQLDIEKAKEYMAKAGIKSLDLRMDIVDEAEYRAWAEVVQQNLKEIGINLEINPLEYGTYWEAGVGDKGLDLELFSAAFQMQPDPSWATMWFTSEQVGVWNWMRWANPEFDKLHLNGLATLDNKERQEIYVQMQQLMDKDAVAVWITHGKSFFAYNPKKVTPALSPHNALQFEYFGAGKE